MILWQAYLFTYSLLRGVTFEVMLNDAATVGNTFGSPVVE